MTIKDLLRQTALYEMYGSLLTKRQQECLELRLYRDYSLSEIGDLLQISRQATFDMISRAESLLEDYEKKIGSIHQQQEISFFMDELFQTVKNLQQNETNEDNRKKCEEILQMILPKTSQGKVRFDL